MNKTILIIDDEEKLSSLLKRLLVLVGFEVLTADALTPALKILDHQSVNGVLCDVKLPDGNGVDFVKQARSSYLTIEIVLLTAYGNIPDGVRAMRNGAFDYIAKGNDNDRNILLRYLQNKMLQRK